MDDKSSNKIIQGKMKNMEVSNTKRKKASALVSGADNKAIQKGPSLQDLQKKYMSPDDGYQPDAFASDSSSAAGRNDEVDVKIIKPKKKSSDSSSSSKDRTVIISKNKGLLGSQG